MSAPVEELRAAARLLRGEPAPEPHPIRLPPRMPAVYAEPLTGLLEGAAALLDLHPDLARQHVDGEPCDSAHCQIFHYALALARAINGTAS